MEKTLGERLREERERLGMHQEEMADAGGVKRNSQGNYERGRQNPDAAYLCAVADKGVDIVYVLLGQRSVNLGDIADDEAEILEDFRSLSIEDKSMVRRITRSLVGAGQKSAK